MKIVILIQARNGSTRLSGKSVMKLGDRTLLEHVFAGVRLSGRADKICLCTSVNPVNDSLCDLAKINGIESFRGDENDVLGRLLEAAKKLQADLVVRVCADNPFINGTVIDYLIDFFLTNDVDYAFNHIPSGTNRYPDGLGAEILRYSLLEKIAGDSNLPEDREHVTRYIWRNKDKFRIGSPVAPPEIAFPRIKLDIDTQIDFDKMNSLYHYMQTRGLSITNAAAVCSAYNEFFQENS